MRKGSSADFLHPHSEKFEIDLLEAKVTICQLNEGRYDEAAFKGEANIHSPTFPDLKLTVDQVLTAQL